MKNSCIAVSVLAVALVGAMPCRAEWKEVGELQIAPLNVIMPQVQTLSAKMKFPLLPMLVKEGIGQCESAHKYGAIDESADWGAKIFADGDKSAEVWAWPVAGGKAAWKKAHPDAKAGDVVFSKDGRYVCSSDEKSLVGKFAEGSLFAKPMKKGLMRATISDGKLFDELEGKLAESAKEAEKLTGQKSETPPWQPKFCAAVKNLQRLAAVLGMSSSGLDIRLRASPKDGKNVDSILSVMKEIGTVVDPSDKAAKAAFPESAKKKPDLVMKIADDPSVTAAAGVSPGNIWAFVWKDGKDLRAILRITTDELAKAAQSMMQIQTQGMQEMMK